MGPRTPQRRTLLLVAFALTSILPATLHASGFGVSGSGGGYSGSGTITATDQGGGQFLITAMSGTGFQSLFASGGFNANDNLLFPTAAQYVDSAGFSFTIAGNGDTDNVNIAWTGAQYQAYIVDEGGNVQVVPVTFNLTPSAQGASTFSAFAMRSAAAPAFSSSVGSSQQFAFSFTQDPMTPEPSSLVLLATGMASLAGLARQRANR